MRWLIIPVILLQGCAYTAASTASLAVTGKSISDHALTALVPNADCRTTQVLEGKYLCEIDDPTRHYNRSGY